VFQAVFDVVLVHQVCSHGQKTSCLVGAVIHIARIYFPKNRLVWVVVTEIVIVKVILDGEIFTAVLAAISLPVVMVRDMVLQLFWVHALKVASQAL